MNEPTIIGFDIPTLMIIGTVLSCFVVWAGTTRYSLHEAREGLERDKKAFRHLAKMAPVLARDDVFGSEFYTGYGYDRRIDPDLVIEKGEKFAQRDTYRDDTKHLRELDKILAPFQTPKD